MDRQPARPLTAGDFLPLLLVAAICSLVFLQPNLAGLLVYDRRAILSGELWRLMTGHLVHFTPAHLCSNLVGITIAGWIIKSRAYSGFGMLCVISALLISGALLLEPDVASFGGISGIVNAAIVFAATRGLEETGIWRRICVFALILAVVNTVLESLTGRPTFALPGDRSFVPVPLSHVIGGLTGAIMGMPLWRRQKDQSLHDRAFIVR